MLSPLITLAFAGALVSGAPVAEASQVTLTEFQCFNASLPNITIFATGGTIAGKAGAADQTTGYQAGAIGIATLVEAVPEICNVSNVRGIQIANLDSADINSTILTNLTQQIQTHLDDPSVQGVVVTHGTDTLEESAFFLDVTLNSSKPAVVVGSMRPATAISADGPINLLSAVKLAVDKDARDRGVMVVLNDRIASARYTVKTNANSLDTFRAEEQGYLGTFLNIKPVFYYPAVRPLGHHYFDISERAADKALPKVEVLYGHQELDPQLIEAAVEEGAVGIVLAGLGAGGWPTEAAEVLEKLVDEIKIPIIGSHRSAWGFVEGSEYRIGSGFLNPAKSRLQLQLALEEKLSVKEIRKIFEFADV